jgi:hypothetical protein
MKILESPHDVTAGLYMMEDMENFAVVKEWDEEFFKKNGTFEFVKATTVFEDQYLPVAYAGMGWMLVRSGVMEKLKYPWFYGPLQTIGQAQDMMSEDVAFCRSLAASGTQVYVDTSIRVGHQKKVIL